uniref:Dehydrogenase/reductase (SDR family) X-linked n=1 Tax=Zonotrichia albicollis TaxID=44394 RepID=A0A8D2QH23_ZONAL
KETGSVACWVFLCMLTFSKLKMSFPQIRETALRLQGFRHFSCHESVSVDFTCHHQSLTALNAVFPLCSRRPVLLLDCFSSEINQQVLPLLFPSAGVMLVPERKTEDGFEEHFGLNYLGHFLLTNLLLDTLKQSGTHSHSARIITVSSATHYVGKLHLNDLQSRCSYSPHGAYAQSKLALVLFTYRLQHLLTANGSHVTANVVDPGVVNTELYQHVFWVVKVVKWMTAWLFFKSPEEGASTTIYAAVSPEMEGAGGCYLYNEERTKSADVAYDEELQRRLWTESCKMVGISDEAGRLP